MTDAELFANLEVRRLAAAPSRCVARRSVPLALIDTSLQAISRELQCRMLKKDASILSKNSELAHVARAQSESERFLSTQA